MSPIFLREKGLVEVKTYSLKEVSLNYLYFQAKAQKLLEHHVKLLYPPNPPSASRTMLQLERQIFKIKC